MIASIFPDRGRDGSFALFYKAGKDYRTRVAKGLKLDVKKVEELAKMSAEDKAQATVKLD